MAASSIMKLVQKFRARSNFSAASARSERSTLPVWARSRRSLHQHQLLSKRLLVEHLVKRYLGATPSQTVHLPGELGVK